MALGVMVAVILAVTSLSLAPVCAGWTLEPLRRDVINECMGITEKIKAIGGHDDHTIVEQRRLRAFKESFSLFACQKQGHEDVISATSLRVPVSVQLSLTELLQHAADEHMFELATVVAAVAIDASGESANVHLLLHIAQLYASSGRPSRAVHMFTRHLPRLQHQLEQLRDSDMAQRDPSLSNREDTKKKVEELELDVLYLAQKALAAMASLRWTDKKERYFEMAKRKYGLPWASSNQITLDYQPGLTAKPYHDPSAIPGLLRLEEHFPTVRSELEQYLTRKSFTSLQSDHALVDGAAGIWTEVLLWDSGEFDDNCKFFPKTCDVIRGIKSVSGKINGEYLGGQVTFFKLNAGAHLRPHVGTNNARLTAHLGVIVPEGPVLIVNDIPSAWTEGKVILFDDSFMHEVYHLGSEARYVLYCSVWHPDIMHRTRPR